MSSNWQSSSPASTVSVPVLQGILVRFLRAFLSFCMSHKIENPKMVVSERNHESFPQWLPVQSCQVVV